MMAILNCLETQIGWPRRNCAVCIRLNRNLVIRALCVTHRCHGGAKLMLHFSCDSTTPLVISQRIDENVVAASDEKMV